MSDLPQAIWTDIGQHVEDLKQQSLTSLFENPRRAEEHTISAAGIHLDYSKNFFNLQTRGLLNKLMDEIALDARRRQMFEGSVVNGSENRPALHTLLRAQQAPAGLKAEFTEVQNTLMRMAQLASAIRDGQWRGCSNQPITDIVHLGIGGSYLGPKMVDEALAAQRPRNQDDRQDNRQDIRCHYVANVDAHHLDAVLGQLDATTTLIIVVSKSFTTLETQANASTARQWLLAHMDEAQLNAHVIAVSTNIQAATDFGVSPDNILPMWDWVGGRYSVWSAVGLPIAIRYGYDVFQQLLAGARAMDEHFQNADASANMPVVMAFLSLVYQQYFGAQSHAVLTYDHRLRYLPDHLQQVDMESLGKCRNIDGAPVGYDTGAIIWGGEGTNGQHAFHQLLHQGTRFVGIDFIMTLQPDHRYQSHHDKLIASCLSQAQALMQGRSAEEITNASDDIQRQHKVMPGNRPSNVLAVERTDAFHTGALIALYEHKVFCQALVWQINPFDQWGVELGKELGDRILNALEGGKAPLDGSTEALLHRYAATRK